MQHIIVVKSWLNLKGSEGLARPIKTHKGHE